LQHPTRTLVSLDAGIDESAVRSALPATTDIQIVGIVRGVDESWTTLQETPTDLLVIACAGYSERALFLIASVVRERPGMPIVVLAQDSPEGFLRRVFEVGADDAVRLPESPEQVNFMIQKVLVRKRATGSLRGTDGTGPMICVLGPKGGTGKTVTATNLAAALAQAGQSVSAVDLDLQFGDLALAMGVRPEKTMYDVVQSGGSLDADKLGAFVMPHESGVRVLVAPTRPDQASSIGPEFLREVYPLLRATSDFVVLDSSPGFTPEVISAIDNSTYVCIVGTLDTLSLKNTRLGLETLDLMGYDPDRIVLVLNRADSRVGIDDDDVLAVVGKEPDVRIPSDVEVPRSVNEGAPIVLNKPDSAAAKAFQTLAQEFLRREGKLAVEPSAQEPEPRSGFGKKKKKKAEEPEPLPLAAVDGNSSQPDAAPNEPPRRLRLSARRR
jgi:pilus assembly protein CpaE